MSTSPTHTLRIFLSSSSADLEAYRATADRVLESPDVHCIIQEKLEPDYQSLVQVLTNVIKSCDVVICLVGRYHGAEPSGQPAELQGLSYTQLEYLIAEKLGKPIFRFFAAEDCEYEADAQAALDGQSPEHLARQLQHHERVKAKNAKYDVFRNHEDLERLLLKIRTHELIPAVEEGRPFTPQTSIHNLPFPPLGNLFKGREEEVAQLESSLTNDSGLVVHQAVKGLGGIGKTRLAVEYAWANRNRYHALLFVTADSPANLRSDLAGLAELLYPELAEDLQGVPQEKALQLTFQWLHQHPGWLLILDNVDAEEAVQAVRDILPRLNQGHVLITSRWNHWRGLRTISLGHLEPDAATAYLLEATEERSRQATDEADARAIAEALEGLALALEQAAAYIDVQAISFAKYRGLLEEKREQVLGWYDARFTDYPNAVAKTWLTTIEKLAPTARALLNLLAWFAPAPIPEFLLDHERGARVFQEALTESGLADPEREWTLRDALAELRSYSLVRAEADAGFAAFGLHRLVLDVSRLQIPEDERQQWLEWALRWVNWAVPGKPSDVRTWDVMDPLHVHAEALAWQADEAGIADPASRLMNQIGGFFWAKALYAQAEPLFRRALEIDEAKLGADHPTVATQLNNLALLLCVIGRAEEAEPLYRRAIKIGEAELGADHPTVAVRLNNLANLLSETGRAEEAKPLFRRALEIGEAKLGANHPDVAIRLSGLANLLRDTGRAEEAEPLLRRAIEIGEAKQGADHPDVATWLSNLANLLRETGRAEEAEPLFRRALEIGEAKLGADHPNVAIWLWSLAYLLYSTNRLDEAEEHYRRAIAIFQASLGEDHPHTQNATQHLEDLLRDRRSS